MRQPIFHAKQLHLVLIGGGHAQIQVLKAFAMRPIEGLAITLVTDVLKAPYSGMLPGCVEGAWHPDDIHIDLTRLASFAGANFIHAHVSAIDAEEKIVLFEDRPPLFYDILSLNCGAVPDLEKITGATEHSIAVKPIAHFLEQLPEKLPENKPLNIIGAGVAGLELAFAFQVKYKSQSPDINVFSRSNTILPKMPKRAGKLVTKLAGERGITIHHGTAITAITADRLTDASGQSFASGMNFLVTGVKPSPFISTLVGALDDEGFVRVSSTLQSPKYPAIFAAGDVASLSDHPREKAGVFAVRAGVILAENLRRYIYNRPLKRWVPQSHYLSLIGTGDGKAIAIRNGFAGHSALFWRLKVKIDKAFMDKFNHLPPMRQIAPPPLPRFTKDGGDEQDPIFADMRCSGCAAKASASLLDNAMAKAIENAKKQGIDATLLAEDGAIAEDAGLTSAVPQDLRHSFDSLNQMLADPYLFAQIAVNHALSDLYVAGAKPLYAQAHLNLEEASEPYQLDMATQYLTGSLVALGQAQAKLIGGHTSQSRVASLGFAVTGAQLRSPAPYDKATDYALVMTKKLGIGMALAAHARQQASAQLYQDVLDTMLISNQQAASCLFEAGAIAITDITGFGLARHATNLLNRLNAPFGLRITLGALPVFDELEALVASGLRSSLHDKNKQAGLVMGAPKALGDWRSHLLHDPQTSGGVLALIPADKAAAAIAKISEQSRNAHPAIIGISDKQATGLLVEL